MKMTKLRDRIYAVEGKTSKEVAKAFLRIQEHYESPIFKDLFFTLDEFKAKYPSTRDDGKFSYFEDWSGFNVPSSVVEKLVQGLFPGKLSKEEKWLVNQIKTLNLESPYYLIGYQEGDKRVIMHEIAHGLYFTKPEYRAEVDQELSQYDMLTHPIAEFLRKKGYNQSVVKDEFHAWLLTDRIHIYKYMDPKTHKTSEKLSIIYQKHM